MTQLEQAKMFRENKIKSMQQEDNHDRSNRANEVDTSMTVVDRGNSFFDEEAEDLDHFRAPLVHVPEQLHSTPPSTIHTTSSPITRPQQETLLPPRNPLAKNKQDPYFNNHSSEEEDDDHNMNSKKKHQSGTYVRLFYSLWQMNSNFSIVPFRTLGLSVVSWVIDTRKECVEIEDAVQLRPRYVHHSTAHEYEAVRRYGDNVDNGKGELRNAPSGRVGYDRGEATVSSRGRSTSAERRNDRNEGWHRGTNWEVTAERKVESLPGRSLDNSVEKYNSGRGKSQNAGASFKDSASTYTSRDSSHYDKISKEGQLSYPDSRPRLDQPSPHAALSAAPAASQSSYSNRTSAALVPTSSAPLPTLRGPSSISHSRPPVDKYYDRARSDESDSNSDDSHRKKKKAKRSSSSQPINPNSMLGRYYQNRHQGAQK